MENEKSITDVLRESVMELVYSDDCLEDAKCLWNIFHEIDVIDTRLNELELQVNCLKSEIKQNNRAYRFTLPEKEES